MDEVKFAPEGGVMQLRRSGRVPDDAEFAVTCTEGGMEPYVRRGGTMFFSREPPSNGEAGLFRVGGELVCRQYIADSEGNVYLFALDRARRDLDIPISRRDAPGLECLGKLLLPAALPLP